MKMSRMGSWVWVRVLGAAFAACTLSAGGAFAGPPVVVELFQSQGCSSCPPANANLNQIAARADVLALSFGVTYWDQLGWKDTFAKPQYTLRQREYANGSLASGSVGTPQMVINGRKDIIGHDKRELDRAIKDAAPLQEAPTLSLSGGALLVGAAQMQAQKADVWLVRYDPRIVEVAVRRGENGGRTLPHRNVVRELVRLGAWSGAALKITLPVATDSQLRTAILVQGARGGPILTALKAEDQGG